MSDKAAVDGPTAHPGRSVRTLKLNFTEPGTFGFFLVFNGRLVCTKGPDGPRLVSDDALLSYG
jgi:hypothetical protein